MLTICISSAPDNADRRASLRSRYNTRPLPVPADSDRRWFSWLSYLDPATKHLKPEEKASVEYFFVLGRESEQSLKSEAKEHGDMLFLDAPEGYKNLWRKTLTFLDWANARQAPREIGPDGQSGSEAGCGNQYFMHVDDDSFVRLDLLLPELRTWPKQRFYWGYIWDPTAGRCTAPIRNPKNKSHMPEEQYPLDYYPPFASGCGFILSWDLVQTLLAQPLPDYDLLDPPFGIHLTGTDRCCLKEPVVPVHDDRVRPYRPMPLFRRDTLIQHYMLPPEMKPFFSQATGKIKFTAEDEEADKRISRIYEKLVKSGLLRQ